MIFPLILIVLAAVASAVVAYGTDPWWAQFDHGIDFILWTRRLQWPLIATAIVLCLALLTLVISGKWRAWWLIALLPILALLVHRFVTGPWRSASPLEDPEMVAADQASFLHDDDYVIGIRWGDTALAFPYSVVFNSPILTHTNHEQRMLLLWSPFANCASAFAVTRELRATDLEIVSSPANALLVYNTRLGQFINGVTGRTPAGQRPAGFREQIAVVQCSWSTWRGEHPASLVLPPGGRAIEPAAVKPLLPRYAMPRGHSEFADQRRVCVVATTQPIAVPSDALLDAPLNLSAGQTPVVLFRPSTDGALLAFDRHVDADLIARFHTAADPKHPQAMLTDDDTNTAWSASGLAITGPKETRGKQLAQLPVQQDVYWGVMKFWYPDLQLATPGALAAGIAQPAQVAQDPGSATASKEPVKRRRRVTKAPAQP